MGGYFRLQPRMCIYREVQLMVSMTNVVCKNLFIGTIECCGGMLIIFTLFIILRLHDDLHLISAFACAILLAFVSIVIIVMSRLAGQTTSRSNSVLSSWDQKVESWRLQKDGYWDEDTKYIDRFNKSCSPIKFQASEFNKVTIQRAVYIIRYCVSRTVYLVVFFDGK